MQQRTISFIGAGNMARSIFSGLIENGYAPHLITVTRTSEQNCEDYRQQFGIKATTDNYQAVLDSEVIVLAVKPQIMAQVCEPFKQIDLSDKIVISIAAGITCKRLYEMLGQKPSLIRVMPNTPSLVGYGMSGLYAEPSVTEEQKSFATNLMNAVGKTCWVENESEINHIIAAAGSAPAYFFLFMQAMEEKAIKLGFSTEQARLLIQQSALGAAHMVEKNSHLSIDQLRLQVISKGGTTAKAIETFQDKKLEITVDEAMQAAIDRAAEMEKEI